MKIILETNSSSSDDDDDDDDIFMQTNRIRTKDFFVKQVLMRSIKFVILCYTQN